MKKFIILAILVLTPLSSFAIVDVEGYAGYNFLGKFSPSDGSGTVSGMNLGARAHFTLDLILVNFGVGAFADYRPLSFNDGNTKVKMDRFSTGPDVFAKLDLPFIPIKPYLRGGMALYDKYQVDVQNTKTTDTYYFKGCYFGAGISYNLISLILVDIQLFGEYLYDISKLDGGQKLNSHRVNFGLTVAI
jgi:hypothetical protein